MADNILPEDSYGFRKGRGITDYGVRLVQILENNKKNNYSTNVVTIDVSKAFDRVKLPILIDTLTTMKVEKKFIYWISESIKHREI